MTVPDYQLSLAIGKEGQNARLAARLTGWRIDIRPDTEQTAEQARPGSDRGLKRRRGIRADPVALMRQPTEITTTTVRFLPQRGEVGAGR